MTKRFLPLCLAALMLAAACGDGGDDTGDGGDATASAAPAASQDSASGPEGLDTAPEGELNRPKSGTYYYDYESESLNAAVPDATPARSKPDAQLARKIGYKGEDGMAVGERTTEGPAVAESSYVWEDDRLIEGSFSLRTDDATNTCTYEKPIEVLRFPLKAGSYGPQSAEGEGDACGGTRTIEVVGEKSIGDANGTAWPVWHIRITTTSESNGLAVERVDQRWLSADLGTDVRYETSAKYINPDGGTSATSESTAVLKTYPS
jgi:hypothetical protein